MDYTDINFEYCKIFYFAAKYGNITKAAAALRSSQPNVTRVIRLLEDSLNCRLFVREPRGISLTEEGERLYYHAEAAYLHLACAREELGGRQQEGVGTIRIGATETALHLFLLEFIRDFKTQYPKIRIRVHNHTTPEILRYLTAGKLDFALITTPFKTPEGFRAETVRDFREIPVGGPQYEYLCESKKELTELAECPLICLGRESVTYDFYRSFFALHNAEMNPDTETATSDLILPLIRHNLGIGFVPESLALPFLEQKELVRIPLTCEVPIRSIRLVSDKGPMRNAAAELFCRRLTAQIPSASRDAAPRAEVTGAASPA